MNKIILAFDGVQFSEGAFKFACSINEMNPISLTGVFLPQAELSGAWNTAMSYGGSIITPIDPNEEAKIETNIERFERLCQQNNIEYRVHKDEDDFAQTELVLESKYADYLILGTESYYKNMGTNKPNNYLKDAIHEVACPVLLVPENYDFPESVILTYDGSKESVYAIKQFAYLFPKMCQKDTLLVYVNEDPNADFPNRIQLEELISQHFSELTLYKLDIDPKKYFATWISERKSTIVVSGSYGRSDLSQIFRKSFIDEIIADHRMPVFIAHK